MILWSLLYRQYWSTLCTWVREYFQCNSGTMYYSTLSLRQWGYHNTPSTTKETVLVYSVSLLHQSMIVLSSHAWCRVTQYFLYWRGRVPRYPICYCRDSTGVLRVSIGSEYDSTMFTPAISRYCGTPAPMKWKVLWYDGCRSTEVL
jgi:hypothetical protein